jgi:hypothetical protein
MARRSKLLIQPHAPAAPDRYCRLLPEALALTQKKMTPEALEKLAWSMHSNEAPIPVDLQQGHAPPPIAVTYFGQFVDHDLTFDSTPLRDAGSCEPIYTVNNRTPWLDLDHLYGDGPRSSRHAHLYQPDNASFRIGESAPGEEPFDIPFTDDGKLALVDKRNGENVMIRQIHAMFLKLHNVAVRELARDSPSCERFDRARERVRWQYQWLVRSWYLREICHPEIYEAVIGKGDRRIDWVKVGFAVPVEFSLAAMRFGHSMVREEYQLNNTPVQKGGSGVIPLASLFGASNRGPLDRRLKIDWSLLSTVGAKSIDTALVEPLFELPDEHIDLYVRTPIPHPPNALPFRTLVRGAAVRLPTGQQVRDALGESTIAKTPGEYEQVDPWDPLHSVGLAEETPLWYYILLEAQLGPGTRIPSATKIGGVGATLGRVGSRLVAEVIEASLQLDPTSFLRRNGPAWTPQPWPAADGKTIEITSLSDVARVSAV